LVNRWPGEAELTGDLQYRLLFGQHLPKHFVFDLQQVPGIEKIALLKSMKSL